MVRDWHTAEARISERACCGDDDLYNYDYGRKPSRFGAMPSSPNLDGVTIMPVFHEGISFDARSHEEQSLESTARGTYATHG